MGRVHFGTFRGIVHKAYRGNDNDAKKAIHTQLKNAKLIGASFSDFIGAVKSYALQSAGVEGQAVEWRDSDDNLEASFASGKGDALKACAIHFYFLSHDKYAGWARLLNEATNLPKLMDGGFETSVFGFGVSSGADGIKRVHPVPSCPSGPFHWPLYVSEEDARSASLDMEGVWLNPLNHFSIPLSHRQEEIALLDSFVRDDRPFLICALVAPSGAGKTRLVSEWMRKFVPDVSDTDWDAGFVTDRKREPWETWDITHNTLIVIDYTYAYDEVMKAIIGRCRYHRDKKAKKVRLLVIDHIYPQVLQDDFFWSQSFVDQGHVDSRKSAILFDRSPIELRAVQAGSLFLREVIAATASSADLTFKLDDPKIIEGELILSKMGQTANSGNSEAVRHPLFAALLGQAIREGRTDPSHWTRRDLIKHYFDKPSRLPWCEDKEGEDRGIWIGAYVAAATLLRGVSFTILRNHLPAPIRKDRAYISRAHFIEQAASRLVSSSNRKTLKPLEPGILGENFLIQFFKFIGRDNQITSLFVNMLLDIIGTDKGREFALNFLQTVQRLVRNLLNDSQDLDDVEESWRILDTFLTAEQFPHGVLRQAVSIIRADTVRQCQAAKQIERAAQFAHNVDSDDRRTASSGPLWRQAATAFMHYFEWQSTNGNIQPVDIISLIAIAGNFRDRWKTKWPILMLAAHEGCLETTKALRKKFIDEDINAVQSEGGTILMVAAYQGHTKVVNWLIELGADFHLTRVQGHWTALMAACTRGHTETARLLLEKGAAVNQGTTDRGWTALMAACQGGHIETARLLLEKDAAVDQGKTNDGRTALMAACHGGHTETARLLLEKGAAVNQGTTDRGWTALMLACQGGHTETARLLLESGAAVNQGTTDGGWTALMAACQGGHTETARLLLEEDAAVNQGKTYDGRTALLVACVCGHTETVALLLESGADVNQRLKTGGWSALMFASGKGHNETVKCLLLRQVEMQLTATHDNGMTSLMIAAMFGQLAVVDHILTFSGISLFQTDEDGRSALDHAQETDDQEVVRSLQEAITRYRPTASAAD